MHVTPSTQRTASARANLVSIIRAADRQLASRNNSLDDRAAAIRPLVECVSTVDADTRTHVQRVATCTRRLAQSCGWYGPALENLTIAATLHDIGKVAIPRELLSKPGSLSAAERAVVEQHTTRALAILNGCSSAAMRTTREVAVHHHERWDGAGYPNRLARTEIPLSARLVALADVYDALTSDRPYRPAIDHETAISMIAAGAGTQFDPFLTSVFLSLHHGAGRCA
jgi:HD-GYP domain-containing protein (c-di-GMP phosphodiesterase class II)